MHAFFEIQQRFFDLPTDVYVWSRKPFSWFHEKRTEFWYFL